MSNTCFCLNDGWWTVKTLNNGNKSRIYCFIPDRTMLYD